MDCSYELARKPTGANGHIRETQIVGRCARSIFRYREQTHRCASLRYWSPSIRARKCAGVGKTFWLSATGTPGVGMDESIMCGVIGISGVDPAEQLQNKRNGRFWTFRYVGTECNNSQTSVSVKFCCDKTPLVRMALFHQGNLVGKGRRPS